MIQFGASRTGEHRHASTSAPHNHIIVLLFNIQFQFQLFNYSQSTIKITSKTMSSSLVLILGVFVVALLAAVLFVSRRRTNTNRTSIHPDAKPVPSAPGATFIHQVSPLIAHLTVLHYY
jgi:hypothetical protein